MQKFYGIAAFAAAGIAATSSATLINEFVANHVGTDTNEYVEIFSTANTDLSTLRLLQIEGDAGGSTGVIDTVDVLTSSDAAGYWWTGFQNNRYENGTISFLLVSGFTGFTGTDIDSNNDGIIDNAPWTSIVDTIGVTDGGAGDFSYANVILTATFDGGAFTPGGASRIPNGVDTESLADWKRNDFDLAGILTGTPDAGEAYNTPNARNVPVPTPGSLALVGLGALAAGRRRR